MQDTLSSRVDKLEKRVAELEKLISSSSSSSSIKVVNVKSKFSKSIAGKRNLYHFQNNVPSLKENALNVITQLDNLFDFPKNAEIYVGFSPGARYDGLSVQEIRDFFDKKNQILVVIGSAQSEDFTQVKTRNFKFNDPNDLVKINTIYKCENCYKIEAVGIDPRTGGKFCSELCAEIYLN